MDNVSIYLLEITPVINVMNEDEKKNDVMPTSPSSDLAFMSKKQLF